MHIHVLLYIACQTKNLQQKFCFNYLRNDIILDQSRLKGFADNRINETQKLKYVFKRVENIVGKEENAGYQHFLLFHDVLKRLSRSLWKKWEEEKVLATSIFFFSICILHLLKTNPWKEATFESANPVDLHKSTLFTLYQFKEQIKTRNKMSWLLEKLLNKNIFPPLRLYIRQLCTARCKILLQESII